MARGHILIVWPVVEFVCASIENIIQWNKSVYGKEVSLRPFFGSKPVREWFNPSASRVVSGEINLERITPQSALVEMILDPAAINGPLMRIGSHCEAGSNTDARFGAYTFLPQPVYRLCKLPPKSTLKNSVYIYVHTLFCVMRV
jgi:hypothetical protein